jgi:hypothetical protein
MPVKTYRMKPVIKDAIQLLPENSPEIMQWMSQNGAQGAYSFQSGMPPVLTIETHMGSMEAHLGDWVVRGLEGEFYPVQDSKFQATYEEVS